MTFSHDEIDPVLDLELVHAIPVTPEAALAAWTDPEWVTQWIQAA